jgi:Amt family ammonium transporter
MKSSMKWLACGAMGLLALPLFFSEPAFAQETTMDKGDTAWMMVATVLVLLMILPGLALFYGGLMRSKNMLSVLMQCTMVTAAVMIVWTLYGYSFAFGGGTSP